MIDYGFLNDFLPKYAKWICVRKTIDGSELLLENGKSSLSIRSRAEKRTFMGGTNMRKKKEKRLTVAQRMALGFSFIILIGAILLSMPWVAKSGVAMKPVDALFTSVSATCVTGLVVADTYTKFNIVGQVILLFLIQIGGLGFMVLGVFLSMMLRKKIVLKDREMIHESMGTLTLSGVIRLTRKIIVGTLLFESIGAALLAIRFIPLKGFWTGVYYGIFHSISAFCNAGFDLMGEIEEYTSFSTYVGDPLMNGVLMALITIGGLGFVVWDDLYRNRWHFRRYYLHTKIVLSMTIFLFFIGSIFFFFLEYNNEMAGMELGQRILASMFSSVTPRTAGFNTMDTGKMTDGSKLLTMFLMYIGGSPGSTAGGIKTTTMAVVVLEIIQGIRKTKGCNVFHRRLEEDAVRKASMAAFLNLGLIFIGTLFLCAVSSIELGDALFEVTSAMGTVGMSTGITRDLNTLGKLMISFLMYCGRMGSLTLAFIFVQKRNVPPVQQPVEKIAIG